MNIHLAVSVVVTLLLKLLVDGFLLRGIRTPLVELTSVELTSVTKQFRQGHLDVLCQYASTNEFGLLAMGTLATAEFVLQLHERFGNLAAPASDALALSLDEARLPKRIRRIRP